MLCSVVKHSGSGRARKMGRIKHETYSSVFPYFLSALRLPKDFTTDKAQGNYEKRNPKFAVENAKC